MKPICPALISMGALALIVNAADAADSFDVWTYKDWYAYRTTSASQQDDGATCFMEADSPAQVGLRVSQFTLDAGPPDAFPNVTRVPDLHNRPIPIPDPMPSTWTFDGATAINVPLTFDYVNGENRLSAPSDQVQALLQMMAKSNELVIEDEVFGSITTSLAGFTANYRKIAELCYFTVQGVLD